MDKTFRFNPFNISEWSNEQIKEQYSELEKMITYGDMPIEISNDIDIYANLGYLIGEMIARYYEQTSILDAKLKVNLSNTIYLERNQWLKMNSDKPPAMTYFESKAQSMYLDDSMELVQKEANLKRFKYAYDSIESKQNALKKKLESYKYEGLR